MAAPRRQVPRRRRSTLTGLWLLGLLLGATLFADVLGIGYWRPHENLWRLNVYTLQRSGERPRVLLLGSSQLQYAVNVPELEAELGSVSAHNVGWAYGNGLRSAVILRSLVRSNGCPELIVAEVSPSLVNGAVGAQGFIANFVRLGDASLLGRELLTLRGLDAYLDGSFSGPLSLYFHRFEPPPTDVVDMVAARGGGRWGTEPAVDDDSIDPIRARRLRRAAERGGMRRYLDHFTLEGLPSRGYERVARIASECDSRLTLLRIPNLVPRHSRRMVDIERRFEQWVQDFAGSRGLSFHDPRAEDVGLGVEHFYDFTHLNQEGSRRFARYLASRVVGPILGERP